MPTRVERRTVNLSAYPDLVVVYLGMRVNRITGIKMLLGIGPQISSSAAARPDGLLRHEFFIWSLFPMHAGIRQYWRDVNSLLEWTRGNAPQEYTPGEASQDITSQLSTRSAPTFSVRPQSDCERQNASIIRSLGHTAGKRQGAHVPGLECTMWWVNQS
jgi:hypothetical protein